MRRWSSEDLRLATLRRQFPLSNVHGDGAAGRAAGPTRDDVLDLVARVAPIQSQVPRAPFVTLASRLPGIGHADVVGLFEAHELIKASMLRGTVFTGDRRQFAWAQRIGREGRAELVARQTKVSIEHLRPLLAAVEERAGGWVSWEDLLDHARSLMRAGPPEMTARVDQVRYLLWGQAGLLRRPPDGAWHKRTDVLRRSSRAALPELPDCGFDEAVAAMVEQHLRAYGPVTTDDLCFYLGLRKTPVSRALAALGGRVISGEGPNGRPMIDLADEAADRTDLPEAAGGVHLLAEFDGLLLGYAGPGRTRFLDPAQLALVWNAKNAVCAPTVLSDGRIVARWRTVGAGRRVRLEVTMLPPWRPLAAEAFGPAVVALERVLDLEVRHVSVA